MLIISKLQLAFLTKHTLATRSDFVNRNSTLFGFVKVVSTQSCFVNLNLTKSGIVKFPFLLPRFSYKKALLPVNFVLFSKNKFNERLLSLALPFSVF